MPVDAATSLAVAMQSNKGVYALLLGSGVSRSAQIPTGDDVILDLIHKVARSHNADCEPDPKAWYRSSYGSDPSYSALLDELAKTAPERSQLLRGYFEPTEEEREQGLKQPTEAHRAIAELVAQGFVRVIITTNFDRLLESALEEVSIRPTVLATPDAIRGALPLVHTRCAIVKVHGDYLDARIRNTPEELAAYPPELNGLLDRIFDEYGLIVCGWSGDDDAALRAALEGAPNRRFTTYWTVRGGRVRDAVARLIELRRAVQVPITDADSFFRRLADSVVALEDLARPGFGKHSSGSSHAQAVHSKPYLQDSASRTRHG